jgi:hypothetical protein
MNSDKYKYQAEHYDKMKLVGMLFLLSRLSTIEPISYALDFDFNRETNNMKIDKH